MDPEPIPWKRYWVPLGGRIVLPIDDFLPDPGSDWGRSLNPDVHPVDLLAEAPCIVLLGEPGSGKSATFAAERGAIGARLADSEDDVIWLDLHGVGSDAQLWRRLFDSPEFLAWQRGGRTLHLFLDGLDECRLQIRTLPALLIDGLRRCPSERLRVRLACRTADWPQGLERGLKGLWGATRCKSASWRPSRAPTCDSRPRRRASPTPTRSSRP